VAARRLTAAAALDDGEIGKAVEGPPAAAGGALLHLNRPYRPVG